MTLYKDVIKKYPGLAGAAKIGRIPSCLAGKQEILTYNLNHPAHMSVLYKIKTSLGDITLSLYDDTPQHKENFEKLVRENYYDGIRFHRVIEGFMIQTGDPLSRNDDNRSLHGTGGPDYRIPAEIKHPNVKGTLAAARDNNPEKASSGSQFYINQADNGFLNGEYTVFGKVTDGLDIVDAIATVEKDFNDNPVVPITIETIEILPEKS